MLRTTDYSQLKPGICASGKEVRICPHCGKAALYECVGGREFYQHSQTVGFDDKGNFVIGSDQCPRHP
jgi:hypothetical protein